MHWLLACRQDISAGVRLAYSTLTIVAIFMDKVEVRLHHFLSIDTSLEWHVIAQGAIGPWICVGLIECVVNWSHCWALLMSASLSWVIVILTCCNTLSLTFALTMKVNLLRLKFSLNVAKHFCILCKFMNRLRNCSDQALNYLLAACRFLSRLLVIGCCLLLEAHQDLAEIADFIVKRWTKPVDLVKDFRWNCHTCYMCRRHWH